MTVPIICVDLYMIVFGGPNRHSPACFGKPECSCVINGYEISCHKIGDRMDSFYKETMWVFWTNNDSWGWIMFHKPVQNNCDMDAGVHSLVIHLLFDVESPDRLITGCKCSIE